MVAKWVYQLRVRDKVYVIKFFMWLNFALKFLYLSFRSLKTKNYPLWLNAAFASNQLINEQ